MQLNSDLADVATKYQKLLDSKLLLRALAKTFDRAHKQSEEDLERLSKQSHNLDPALFDDAYTYKPARVGDLSATATVSGRGLSLRTFVVSGGTKGQPVGVFVKEAKTLRSAFLVRSPSGKDIGVFTRDTARGKAATDKGTYSARTLTRGPNAGKSLERQRIEKLFTMSTPSAVKANVPQAFDTLELASIYQEECESLLRQMGL